MIQRRSLFFLPVYVSYSAFLFLLGDNFCNSAKHELGHACEALQRPAMGTIIRVI